MKPLFPFTINVVANPAVPRDRAYLMATPSAAHQLAMADMGERERMDYLARNRLVVAIKNIEAKP